MSQETAFFKALAAVRTYKLEANGLLYFHDAGGRAILRMSRSDK
jgi:heat shock protein HslJ